MEILTNAGRGREDAIAGLEDVPAPSVDVDAVLSLLGQCPAAEPTPLREATGLARSAGVQSLHVKDERTRMGLGSFKALGAAYVVAREAMETGSDEPARALEGVTYVTASAGNHGLSVAAGARIFGARAAVYIAETVPEGFADRLRAKGAEVMRAGADYEASMAAAQAAAEANGWRLLSDSSWSGYMVRPWRLMEGYLALMEEVFAQMPAPPTHVFLQAGVGGLAAAAAALARSVWRDGPAIVVVEPSQAAALQGSIRAGAAVQARGGVSSMGRLDCKMPSLIALKGLSRDADVFVTIDDGDVEAVLPRLADAGLATTPSGAAGLAVPLTASAAQKSALGLGPQSRILAILSEEAEA
ncbi:pyridoxal-phosphate dependent enzyme [Stappia stellulata]|uniref:pyridoxal-phosphate dependent enzyme n=1 Tax=Stappia stellulata TaxID=71235 RepID=UPI001CD675AB|nr:pyridoxal-phosphate dependent enzyme [Stappia stellulata]MCA1241548.1 pyridoxal-phosphate dependent enzyme [Stappia stellulata]